MDILNWGTGCQILEKNNVFLLKNNCEIVPIFCRSLRKLTMPPTCVGDGERVCWSQPPLPTHWTVSGRVWPRWLTVHLFVAVTPGVWQWNHKTDLRCRLTFGYCGNIWDLSEIEMCSIELAQLQIMSLFLGECWCWEQKVSQPWMITAELVFL